MRINLLLIGLLIGAVAGCSNESSKKTGLAMGVDGSAKAISSLPTTTALPLSAVASHPDRGELLAYEDEAIAVERGPAKWYPVKLSEEHALRAVATGNLRVNTPEGRPLDIKYKRHVEHRNGNWTWIGEMDGAESGREAVLTFGEKAVFGSIPYDDAEPLKLAMSGGRTWLVQTDPVLAAAAHGAAPNEPDFVIPQISATTQGGAAKAMASAPPMAKSHAGTLAIVDIALGYTTGLASSLGGQSQAVTRLTHLVDLTNQAYAASGVNGRLRLAETVMVDYPDATSNRTTLFELTGVECASGTGANLPDGSLDCTSVGQPAALQPLIQARESSGADVVSLVRRFETAAGSCGIGWMLGAGQREITAADAAYATSVISDSSSAGTCRDDMLAHEVGHNLGLQHDRETAQGSDDTNNDGDLLDPQEYGRYPYSFAHSTGADAGSFYTIMAIRRLGQVGYLVFSNPNLTSCGGQACGVVDRADNVRSLNQTMRVVAGFRAAVTPGVKLDLYSIFKVGASGSTEIFPLEGASNFSRFRYGAASGLARTGSDKAWNFQLADYDGDGTPDLYTIFKVGASNTTEVHILNGADRFKTFLFHGTTALPHTGSDNRWIFKVGDYNRDGIQDVYGILRDGASGRTEIHVLDGADNFRSYLANVATALGSTGNDYAWEFALADYNADGILDVYTIFKSGASGRTEIHVLDGATVFQTYLLNSASVLQETGSSNAWNFKVGDYDNDGKPDVYAIYKQGGSGQTEVYVMNGADGFHTFVASIVTALYPTGTDASWEFELAPPN